MSQAEEPSGSLASRLIKDPSKPVPNFRVFVGYRHDQPPDDEHELFYLDPTLRQPVLLLKASIRHRESVAGGAERVWYEESMTPATSGLAHLFAPTMAFPPPGVSPMPPAAPVPGYAAQAPMAAGPAGRAAAPFPAAAVNPRAYYTNWYYSGCYVCETYWGYWCQSADCTYGTVCCPGTGFGIAC